MDDTLERPTAVSHPIPDDQPEDDNQSSGDEEDGPDWTKLSLGAGATARPIIPKRGEKDFEPAQGGGSGLQVHVLDRAREAMLNALRGGRGTSNKSISYGVWYPTLARAHVTTARGIHFATMGHSVPRPVEASTSEGDGTVSERQKLQRRLELLPEEALYLVERGAMFCWKTAPESELDLKSINENGENEQGEATKRLEKVEGAPMSVQQAYAEMIGREELSLEKYQVFAYLKRLGYVVTRTKPPNEHYPTPAPRDGSTGTTFWERIVSLFTGMYSQVGRFLARLGIGAVNWWKPLQFGRWCNKYSSYAEIFKTLRFIPSGHSAPLREAPKKCKEERKKDESPYQIFYNLYKPSTAFRKSAPGPPDFEVVVVDARTTTMPTLHELTSLFAMLPEIAPPLPRQRAPTSGTNVRRPDHRARPSPFQSQSRSQFQFPPKTQLPFQKYLGRLYRQFGFDGVASGPAAPEREQAVRRPNPFLALKTGKKNVVLAAVDGGNISFFRFGMGAFEEWPMT